MTSQCQQKRSFKSNPSIIWHNLSQAMCVIRFLKPIFLTQVSFGRNFLHSFWVPASVLTIQGDGFDKYILASLTFKYVTMKHNDAQETARVAASNLNWTENRGPQTL